MAKSRSTKSKNVITTKAKTTGENVEEKKITKKPTTAKKTTTKKPEVVVVEENLIVEDKNEEVEEVVEETKEEVVEETLIVEEKNDKVVDEVVDETKVDTRSLPQHIKFTKELQKSKDYIIYHRNTLIYNSKSNKTEIVIRPTYFMIGAAKFGFAGIAVKHV